MITPKDHMSQLLSYFSEANTSGAVISLKNSNILIRRNYLIKLTNVIRGVTRSFQSIGACVLGKAEISQFKDSLWAFLRIQKIFRFQITVCYVIIVEVLHSDAYLMHSLCSFCNRFDSIRIIIKIETYLFR